MQAGKLSARVAFDAPQVLQNGQGGTYQGWAEQHTCWANLRFLRGSETALQGRLAGRQPVVVTIRSCAAAQAITAEWRMRDARTGAVYNLRSIVPTDDRMYLELTAESGVPT